MLGPRLLPEGTARPVATARPRSPGGRRWPAARSPAGPGGGAGTPPGRSPSPSRSRRPPRTAASRTGRPCRRRGTGSARCCDTSLRSGSAAARCRRHWLQNEGGGERGAGRRSRINLSSSGTSCFQLKRKSLSIPSSPLPAAN